MCGIGLRVNDVSYVKFISAYFIWCLGRETIDNLFTLCHRLPILLRHHLPKPSSHHSLHPIMDPLSAFGVAAGVAQFVDLAIRVSQSLSQYYRSVNEAPKLSRKLQQEACVVSVLLKELKSTFEATKSPKITMELMTTLIDIVDEFSKTMTDLEGRLTIKDGELTKRLKWPFNEKENENYFKRLERYKTTFILALTTIQRYIRFERN